ncbi:MAG: glycogen debranching protein, partial [Chloroflexi bacterium]
MIDFGRDLCSDLPAATRREWLVTNGIGGFAMGTLAGTLTRRYHGLLVAALNPPLGRTLLLAKVDDTFLGDGQQCDMFTNHWAGGTVEPMGVNFLENFRLEGTTPVWTFACGDILLEKRIWMEPGANITYLRYDQVRGNRALVLNLKTLVNYRGFHSVTRAGDWQMNIEPVTHGLRVTAFEGAVPFYLLSRQADPVPRHTWYRNFHLSLEEYRGLEAVDDHLHAATFKVILQPGESVTLAAGTEESPNLDGHAAYAARRAEEERWLAPVLKPGSVEPSPELRQLALAAGQFVVRRPLPDGPDSNGSDGHSVIAGYPWFSDWGRDTMIALPGLTLATGHPDIARSILRTYARFVDRGMLPNRFPAAGETPEYNTADASLWYFEAIRAYHAATGDDDLLAELFPVLETMIDWHRRGTRYNIHVDPLDGLLYAGEEGVQLTWMDAKVGDW